MEAATGGMNCVTVGGLTFQLADPFDILGLVEVHILDVYSKKLIKRGDTVLDIGAGIGDFAALASRLVGEEGRVIAVEPSTVDYDTLIKNLRRNRCSNVLAIRTGIAQSIGQTDGKFKGRWFSFQTQSIRGLLQDLQIRSVQFIKIDIEGMERDVIESSINELALANTVAIEFHHDQSKAVQLLTSRGFRQHRLRKAQITRKAMRFFLTHPFRAMEFYRRIADATGRSPIRALLQGPEITSGRRLQVVVFKKSNDYVDGLLRGER